MVSLCFQVLSGAVARMSGRGEAINNSVLRGKFPFTKGVPNVQGPDGAEGRNWFHRLRGASPGSFEAVSRMICTAGRAATSAIHPVERTVIWGAALL